MTVSYMKSFITSILFVFLLSPNASANEVTPWTPYQLITEIVHDLEEICKAQKINPFINFIALDTNKTPTDVYNRSYELLEKVTQLIEKEGFKTNYTVTLPDIKTGRKLPSDVSIILQKVRDAVHHIKSSKNIDISEKDIEENIVVTPPYVYQKLLRAIALVDKLL